MVCPFQFSVVSGFIAFTQKFIYSPRTSSFHTCFTSSITAACEQNNHRCIQPDKSSRILCSRPRLRVSEGCCCLMCMWGSISCKVSFYRHFNASLPSDAGEEQSGIYCAASLTKRSAATAILAAGGRDPCCWAHRVRVLVSPVDVAGEGRKYFC